MSVPGGWVDKDFLELEFDGVTFRERGEDG